MARAIYDYTKSILERVSFDVELFCRELSKAVQILLPFELNELKIWLFEFTKDKPQLLSCISIIEK
jgi:DNA replication protein DnaD